MYASVSPTSATSSYASSPSTSPLFSSSYGGLASLAKGNSYASYFASPLKLLSKAIMASPFFNSATEDDEEEDEEADYRYVDDYVASASSSRQGWDGWMDGWITHLQGEALTQKKAGDS